MERSSAMLAALETGVGLGVCVDLHDEAWNELDASNGCGETVVSFVSTLIVFCKVDYQFISGSISPTKRLRGTHRPSGQF